MARRPIPTLLLALALAGTAPGAHAFKCMPVYGNWCGVDYPPAGTAPPPVDPFDAACMRHDLCTAGAGPVTACDIAFVAELRRLALAHGGLPRPLQWAEYLFRVKAGGPRGGMPLPTPSDAWGILSGLVAPCW
jgi:hypothetical protein